MIPSLAMPETFTSAETRGPRRWLAPAFVGLAFVGMAAQLYAKIDRYAVNIFFSDQWFTADYLIRDYGVWRSFAAQYGPPSLGVGALLSEAVARATGWDSRAEAFAAATILILVAVAAVYLKWRLFKSLTVWDALIPLICMSLPQIPAHTIVPFLAYSAVPVLLLMLYAVCLTFKDVRLRYGALAVLNFLLVFSCWGIFVGMLTPFLLAYTFSVHAAARDARAKRWAAFAFAASVVPLVVFFYGYRFWPAVECFRFPHYPLRDYFWFFAHLFSYSTGVACGSHSYVWTRGFGTLILLPFVCALAFTLWRLARRREYDARRLVVAVLILFTFAFALNAAVGRVCTGVCAANAERYQTLLTPAWLGLYFVSASLGDGRRRAGAGLLILAFCFVLPQWRASFFDGLMNSYSEVKTKWRACYLETGDAEACDRAAGMSIAAPAKGTDVLERIEYLKQRRLSFYADK
jgi:hypothetical protein